MTRIPPDVLVARHAARQQGVVTTPQARRLGLTAAQIHHRCATRRWRMLHRGVYLVGQAPLSTEGRYLAAVLGGGPDAVLSHRSAASLWLVQPHHGVPSHVTSAIPRADRDDITTHWTRRFDPGVRTVRRGIPVTTLARTLIDLAEVGTAAEVETAVRAAERIHDFDRRLIVPIEGRRSSGRFMPPARFHRGDLEPLLRRLLDRLGLEEPVYNGRWEELELDAVWWDLGLVLEVDDWETHRHREAFVRDRRRARRLQAAGLRVIHCTYEDLTADADRFGAELRALGVPLRARGGRG